MISLTDAIGIVALVFSIIGGAFGLTQWKKGNDYKRAEKVQDLIDTLRNDKEIAFIIDMIDWSDGFEYEGNFHFINEERKVEFGKDDAQLFVSIDKTLSYFNYICYLKKLRIFYNEDMSIFSYEIRRLFDNKDICNYLYSLSLWSKSLNIQCSYNHLIKYGLQKGFITKDFLKDNSEIYKRYLNI